MSNVATALDLLIEGFTLIGDAITMILVLIFAALGLPVPDWAVRLIVLAFTGLAVWRFGKMIPKLLLVAIGFVALSTVLGLITPWLA